MPWPKILGAIHWTKISGQHFNSNLLTRPAWEYLRISESVRVFKRLWSYLKAKETLLWLCCPCYCCWIQLENHSHTVDKSLLAHNFVRSKWYGNLCWTIPIKNRLSWQFPLKKLCFVAFQGSFLELILMMFYMNVFYLPILKKVVGQYKMWNEVVFWFTQFMYYSVNLHAIVDTMSIIGKRQRFWYLSIR